MNVNTEKTTAGPLFFPRLGLCCTFSQEPIRFRTTTVRYASSLSVKDKKKFLYTIAQENIDSLSNAIFWCIKNGIYAFRVKSDLLPLVTHPEHGYTFDALDPKGLLREKLLNIRMHAKNADIRLSFHPDQFVVPGSVRPEVVQSSLKEIEYQALLAEYLGATNITLHGGGAQDGKLNALERTIKGLNALSERARSRICLENDDRTYTVKDLLPLCLKENIPLVYDVHHHRCNSDGLSIEEATNMTQETWGLSEPWAHISSPKNGWHTNDPSPHADHIERSDFPSYWIDRRLTVDIEAKAKEVAVLRVVKWFSGDSRHTE